MEKEKNAATEEAHELAYGPVDAVVFALFKRELVSMPTLDIHALLRESEQRISGGSGFPDPADWQRILIELELHNRGPGRYLDPTTAQADAQAARFTERLRG